MDERERELRRLATGIQEHEDILDAFLAKSFTDRLLIVDTRVDHPIPDAVRERLATNGLDAVESVYSDDSNGRGFPGNVGDATRHHFVDVRTRGAHQSYVID